MVQLCLIFLHSGHVEVARREEALPSMSKGSNTDPSCSGRQVDDLAYWSLMSFRVGEILQSNIPTCRNLKFIPFLHISFLPIL